MNLQNRNKSKMDLARARMVNILQTFLKVNCTAYEWAKPLDGFIRSRRFDLLYAAADRLSTGVFETATEHLVANQLVALIKKYPFDYREIGQKDSPTVVAVRKFFDAEKRCRITNRRFRSGRYLRSQYAPYVHAMREWIRRVIGDEPPLSDIFTKCDFGSGASIGVHGNATNLFRKLSCEDWTVTPSAIPFATHALWSNDQIRHLILSNGEERIVSYDYDMFSDLVHKRCKKVTFNKISFVPKTAKVDRPIAVEPLLNTFVQKGIDRVLREKLKARGFDLESQSKNQHLARQGSFDGSLATLDLSSASDSVSLALCKEVLPAAWFSLLDTARSPSFLYEGKTLRYEKIASMGNGFCFPLETLIFAAMVRAVQHVDQIYDRRCAVYGDDIIVSVNAFDSLVKLLSFCGFTINRDKTFFEGPFRESCGADWYLGQDVRPVYLDYHLVTTSDLMIFHNATLRSADVSALFEPIRHSVRLWAPEKERLLRPYGSYPKEFRTFDEIERRNFDGAFTVDLDTFMNCKTAKWCRYEWRWKWKEFVFKPLPDRSDHEWYHRTEYLAFLRSPGGQLSLRRKAKRLLIVR